MRAKIKLQSEGRTENENEVPGLAGKVSELAQTAAAIKELRQKYKAIEAEILAILEENENRMSRNAAGELVCRCGPAMLVVKEGKKSVKIEYVSAL